MTEFPCSKCGLCCKILKDIKVNNFPYIIDETGKCEKLTDDNLCSVYDNRPFICNIEEVTERIGINKSEFYKLNIEMCNKIKKDHEVHD